LKGSRLLHAERARPKYLDLLGSSERWTTVIVVTDDALIAEAQMQCSSYI
jgi:hypothetical protein